MTKLKDLIVDINSTIKDVLNVIDKNARGICFVVSDRKILGIVTDGDIRRGLLKGANIADPIINLMNEDFVKLHFASDTTEIRKLFSNKIKIIPLIDDEGNVVDFADSQRGHRIPILEPQFSGNELNYLENCIKTSWISSQGEYVNKFEKIFEEMHPGSYAIAVSNGTVALHLALLAHGIRKNDEVIVPDLTFAASVNSILYTGAEPVLCEIDKYSWCIDVNEIKKLITPKTKAIMPVHLYGHPCNMTDIINLSKKYNLLVIEDCAEAIGSKWNGKPVGIFGNAATFSFFGNKTITTGEGGMVLFKNKEVADKARILRDHGMNKNIRYWHDVIGYNFRLTNLQAAVGVAQLERFEEIIEIKRKIAYLYSNKLRNNSLITIPAMDNDLIFHSYWLYTILLDERFNRNDIIHKLLLNGIDTRPVFYSIHSMPPYKNYKKSESLKISLDVSKRGLSLPSSVTLTEEDIDNITNTLDSLIRNVEMNLSMD